MANPYINKVILGSETLLDLTADTVTPQTLYLGVTAHDASGAAIVGTMSGGGTDAGTVTQDADGYLVLDDEAPSGRVTVEALSVTQNGTYTAPTGKAYSPVTVNVSGGGGDSVKLGVLRPDAELVQTWSYDKYIIADEGVTLPSYSTSKATLKNGEALAPTYTLDLNAYEYALVCRMLAIPTYNSDSKSKGRFEYAYRTCYYEVVDAIPILGNATPSNFSLTFANNNVSPSRTCSWYTGTDFRCISADYGAGFGLVLPTLTNGVLTVSSPSLCIMGNSNYMSSTWWSNIVDIRYQYIFELYRVSKSSNVKGFALNSLAGHTIECANSASGTLT